MRKKKALHRAKKALFIDGNHLFYRSFFAIKDLSTPEGIPTNAIFGFLKSLLRLVQSQKPNVFAVCFDTKGGTYRSAIVPTYKANRPVPPSSLIEQSKRIREILSFVEIPWFEQSGFEADDLLATLAKQYNEKAHQVFIYSGDKDLLQLISPAVHVLVPVLKQKEPLEADEAFVFEKYGVYPSQIVDFKSLVGDPSDNIKGVPKIGPKTASKMLQKYGSIQGILKSASKEKDTLLPWIETLENNQQIITLQRDAPIAYQENDLLFSSFSKEKWITVSKDYSFRSLLRDIQSVHGELFLSSSPTLYEDPPPSLGKDVEVQSWDDTTTDFIEQEILSRQECAIVVEDQNVSIATPHIVFTASTASLKKSQIQRKSLLHWMQKETIHKWVFDIKRMGHILEWDRVDSFQNVDDAQLLHFLAKPNAKQYTMKDFQLDAQEAHEVVPAQSVLQYAPVLLADVKRMDEIELYQDTEKPLSSVLYNMETMGIKINIEYLEKSKNEMERKIELVTAEIYELAGQEFNISSPKQLGFILFEKMGLPSGRKTKTGYSTDAEVLESIKSTSPIVEKIVFYRECTKMLSTYIVGLQKTANDQHMIHTTYLQAGPATGRISSVHPNMQNLPSDPHWGQYIKEAFVVRQPDSIFISADYSQIDLRVLAHYSKDARMTQAFHDGKDIHAWTARQIFGIADTRDVSREYRNIAKTVNFGVIYGMTPHGLSQSLHISMKEAKQFIDMYFRTFPGVREFINKAIQSATEKGYASTLLGRRRPIPELQSSNHIVQSFGERLAVNTVIQGTSADIIKKAMISIDTTLKDSFQTKMILQIHDEIITEGPMSEQNEVQEWIQKIMTTTTSLRIPLNIQMHHGKTLASLKS
ncbi:MAG: DNA polymerase I [Caldisericia bacterium]|nr:DNA polymerase I [Caldisericia bacterium]